LERRKRIFKGYTNIGKQINAATGTGGNFQLINNGTLKDLSS